MKQIRALDGLNAHTPVIALTAHALSGVRDEMLAHGFDDYVTKPIDREKLLAAMENLTAENTQIRTIA